MKIDVSYLKKLLGAFADSDKAHITLSEIEDCSGQVKLATVLGISQNSCSDLFGVRPPLY